MTRAALHYFVVLTSQFLTLATTQVQGSIPVRAWEIVMGSIQLDFTEAIPDSRATYIHILPSIARHDETRHVFFRPLR